jgi:hypothetical protein
LVVEAAEIRQLAVGVLIAAADNRVQDLAVLLAGADRDALMAAAGGLAIAVGCVLEELPEDRRVIIRQQFTSWALDVAVRA